MSLSPALDSEPLLAASTAGGRLIAARLLSRLALLACSFAWIGVYNVAASTGHFSALRPRFLRFGMENSVRARAPTSSPPPQDDEDMVRIGAGHFHAGCSYCHGAPARRSARSRPDAAAAARPLRTRSAWARRRTVLDRQAWAEICRHARLARAAARRRGLGARRLPAAPADYRARGYRALAPRRVQDRPAKGREIATGREWREMRSAPVRAAMARRVGGAGELVPVLHGQPKASAPPARFAGAYAAGTRDSGIMQASAASDLFPNARSSNSRASMPGLSSPPRHNPLPADGAAVDRWRCGPGGVTAFPSLEHTCLPLTAMARVP